MVPPIEISRVWLLAMVAAAAVIAIATERPLSSFAAGFAAGAGAVFVMSFLIHPRRAAPPDDAETP